MMTAKDWVKKRAECTLPNLFAALERQIRADVCAYNCLSRENETGRYFAVGPKPAGPHEVERTIGESAFAVCHGEWRDKAYHQVEGYFPQEDNDDCIALEIRGGKILACRTGGKPLEISTWWNDDTLTCDYFVGDKAMNLAQLSQRIIGDFLFETS
ncbi:MAG: hypothetical protein OXI23_12550 [Gemmatimonadota bacterium]|nr:hypothetical protein [Gemmatimonadota bacterium]